MSNSPERPAVGRAAAVAGRAVTTAALFSLDPSEALHHGFRGLTVVALWDSPGRLPGSHRLPRAYLRNLLIKHCHTLSSLAGAGSFHSHSPKDGRLGKRTFLARPGWRSASSHVSVYLYWRSSKPPVTLIKWAESGEQR